MEGGNDDDIDPDRLEKTPNSFLEKPLLLEGVGEIRPVFELIDSGSGGAGGGDIGVGGDGVGSIPAVAANIAVTL